MKTISRWLTICGLFLFSPEVFAQYAFTYQTNGSVIALTGYTGTPVSITIPSFVSTIGETAFRYCTSLTSVTIPSNVTTLEEAPFEVCPNLKSVNISEGVVTIGWYAFAESGLTNVVIPSSVLSISWSSFRACPNLTNFSVSAENTNYSSLNGVLYDKSQLSIITYPAGRSGSYTIPSNVTNIATDAFYECSNLTSVTIPNGVTSITAGTFLYCTSLTSLIIPGSVTFIGDMTFAGETKLKSYFFAGNAPTSVGNSYEYNATAYYLPGSTGWGDFSANTGLPAVLWNPLIQSTGPSFGVSNNQFGFNITGTANIPIVVEACTNLSNPVWTPLQYMTLTSGSVYFSDSQWTNYPVRYYGIGFP